jgi:hypothetical protein
MTSNKKGRWPEMVKEDIYQCYIECCMFGILWKESSMMRLKVRLERIKEEYKINHYHT